MSTPRFPLGRLVATPGALARVPQHAITTALARHLCGDWGDVDPEDRLANEDSLVQGLRLLSVYHTANRIKFWIITEADRSVTTVLLPEDY